MFSEAAEPLVHSPAACHQQQQQGSHDNNRRMDRHSDLQDETMFRTTGNTNRSYESRLIRHQPTSKWKNHTHRWTWKIDACS